MHSRLLLFVLLLSPASSPVLAGQATAATAAASQPKDSANSSLAEADSLFRQGRYVAAAEAYKGALQQEPASAVAHAGLTRSELKLEDVVAAHQAAQKGLEGAPNSSLIHSVLGDVYFREGKIAEAEGEYAKAQQMDISNARAWFGRSRIYRMISMYRHAYDYLRKAHELDPHDRDIQRSWFSTLRLSEQISELEKYLASATGDSTEQREGMQRRLELLKERQKYPARACKLAKKVAQTETSLEPLLTGPRSIRGWGLRVNINGNNSRLLLDTGASGIVINRNAAEKAGLSRLMETKMTGIGDKGPVGGYLGYADSIRIGDLEFQDCLVEVSDKRSVADEAGLIGADVFSAYLVTLDFPDRKLKLRALPPRPDDKSEEVPQLKTIGDSDKPAEGEKSGEPNPPHESAGSSAAPNASTGPKDRYIAPEMQAYTKVFRFGHDLLIPTKVGDGAPMLFLIDTGASSNLISPEAARAVTKVRSDSNTRVKGLSGSVKEVSRADQAVIQFSRYRQENQDILTIDLSKISKSTGTEVSGVLGFSTLRMMEMTIDYRDGLVDFTYDPKRLGLPH